SVAGRWVLSLKMILAASGLDPDRDVSYLATGPSASRFAALQAGQVDATTLTPRSPRLRARWATLSLKISLERRKRSCPMPLLSPVENFLLPNRWQRRW